jgi:hypothetical protein
MKNTQGCSTPFHTPIFGPYTSVLELYSAGGNLKRHCAFSPWAAGLPPSKWMPSPEGGQTNLPEKSFVSHTKAGIELSILLSQPMDCTTDAQLKISFLTWKDKTQKLTNELWPFCNIARNRLKNGQNCPTGTLQVTSSPANRTTESCLHTTLFPNKFL